MMPSERAKREMIRIDSLNIKWKYEHRLSVALSASTPEATLILASWITDEIMNLEQDYVIMVLGLKEYDDLNNRCGDLLTSLPYDESEKNKAIAEIGRIGNEEANKLFKEF